MEDFTSFSKHFLPVIIFFLEMLVDIF